MAENGNTGSVKRGVKVPPGTATTKPARPMPENAAPTGGGVPVAPDATANQGPAAESKMSYIIIGLAAFLAWRYLR